MSDPEVKKQVNEARKAIAPPVKVLPESRIKMKGSYWTPFLKIFTYRKMEMEELWSEKLNKYKVSVKTRTPLFQKVNYDAVLSFNDRTYTYRFNGKCYVRKIPENFPKTSI